MKLASSPTIPYFSTGSLRLDYALGIGGIPRGQFVEITGPEGSGKTTLCQHIIAEAQKVGGVCAFIDADHTFNPAYAQRCGVQTSHLYLSEPGSAEEAFNILESLANSGAIAVCVLDSMITLVPEEELRMPLSEPTEDHSHQQLSITLRRLSSLQSTTETTTIITNRPPKYPSEVYHNLAAETARLSLKLKAGIRLDLQPKQVLLDEGKIIGNCIRVRVIKNKYATVPRAVDLEILYNDGIIKIGEIVDLGALVGVIHKRGDRFFLGDIPLGEGRNQAVEFLKRNASICDRIEKTTRQLLFDHP